MGIPIAEDEVVFRCNLVTVGDGRMQSYCAGHIRNDEAEKLMEALNEGLGGEDVKFYTGVGYRHLLKLKGHGDTLEAICTPPHDIPGKPVAGFLPRGKGSEILNELMSTSEKILCESSQYDMALLGQRADTAYAHL